MRTLFGIACLLAILPVMLAVAAYSPTLGALAALGMFYAGGSAIMGGR